MRKTFLLTQHLALLLFHQSATSFVLLPNTVGPIGVGNPNRPNNERPPHQHHHPQLCLSSTSSSNTENDEHLAGGVNRRSVLSITSKIIPAVATAVLTGSFAAPRNANGEDRTKKVVVFGGSGYVGSRVVELLSHQGGYTVVSVSRSSPAEQAAKIKANTGTSFPTTSTSSSVQFASLNAATDDLTQVLQGTSVVVSCVGIPPWEKATARAGNGAVNARIAAAAQAIASVETFVYVSVSSDFANGPAKFLFGDFVKGKAEAESAVLKEFGTKAFLLVKPGLIEGAPPGELRPPGPPGIPTISPTAVAQAVVAGVVGQASGTLDGYAAIMAVAK
jgi:threonine dehydrogenase-like Zn-dependent dehydrogenase